MNLSGAPANADRPARDSVQASAKEQTLQPTELQPRSRNASRYYSLPSPVGPSLGLSTGPCRECRDSGVLYAWHLIDARWTQAMGPCVCVLIGEGDYV